MKLQNIALAAALLCLILSPPLAGPAEAEFCGGIYASCQGLVLSTGAGLNSGMLACFLDQGLSVDCRYEGNTPLIHSIIWSPDAEVVKLLIDQGADVNARNAEGETALGVAEDQRAMELKRPYWPDLDEVIAVLRRAGATR